MGINFLPGRGSYVTVEDKVYLRKIDNTTLEITAYLTNNGLTDSGYVTITVFVKDADGISLSKAEKDVGVIPSKTTRGTVLTPTVPIGQKYYVDILVFEGGKKIESAKSPTPTVGYGAGGLGLSKERVAEKPTIPGFEGFMAIIAVCLAIAILRREKNRR